MKRSSSRDLPPLGLLVFVVGAASLGAEIAAARLMAPFFGASTIVWANIIGVVLVSLAVGYWFGGRFADRHPHKQGLCVLVLVAALAVCAIPFVADPFLDISVDALDNVSAGAFIGSLVAVSVLVAPPVMLLGAASPYAIRLAVERVEESGTVAGRMYAISTIGSLAGTWTSALLLVPLVGTRRTFLIFGLACAMVAVTGIARRAALAVPAVIVALLALPVGTIKAAGDGKVLAEAETDYQYARVVEKPDGERELELNEGQAVHSVYRPGSYLTGDYWDEFLVLPFASRSSPPRAVAILGNAAGTTARALGRYFPDTSVDAVEIDSELTTLGRRWFDLRNPRMRVHHEDARPYLRRTSSSYDAIMVDVYRQPYIPFYLATREFFELVRDHLDSGWGGGRERRPSRGPGRPRKGAVGHDGGGVRNRRAGSERGHQHAGDRHERAAVGTAAAPLLRAHARRSAAGGRVRRRLAWRPRSREARSTRTTRRRSSGWWTSRSWIMRRTGSRQTREGT